MAPLRSVVLPAIVSTVVVASVVTAIVILGGPGNQRRHRMDEVRVQDLSQIVSFVNVYVARHKQLPADLNSLAKEAGKQVPLLDPGTGTPYGYEILTATTYRVCADFNSDSASNSAQGYNANVDANWVISPGRRCFERTT